jgi:glycosyltransferase involved in cell wall biosynthesis
MDFFQVSSSQLSPIFLGYDSQKFRPIKNLPPPPSKYFLYVGRYDYHKNLGRLVDAFASLKTDVELWLAGSVCSNQTVLNQKVKELNIASRVKFLNYVTDSQLPMLMNQAVCLLFPSLWEGFGLPIIEAMACGTPVITSNCSSLKEVAGDAALLVNPYNTQELADYMKQVLNDSYLAETLRQKGLERVKYFSWQKTGTQTVEVLKRFL